MKHKGKPRGRSKYGPEPMSSRLLREKNVNERGCWLWCKSITRNGYGRLNVANAIRLVHRVSWETFVGPIPPNLLVLHSCDVRNCFNPRHLFVGTPADNTADMLSKGRARGAPRKYSDDIARLMFVAHASGVSQRVIADDLGISQQVVSKLIARVSP